jgi:organic radical activating enzyme
MPLVTIADGVIYSHKLEFNAASHCNYSCAECSHLSPYMRRKLPDLGQFRDDVRALASVYRADRLHLVGGEPLLNPELATLIAYARESGLARRVLVATNGALLHKISDELFQNIDELSVSWYPDPRCDTKKIEAAKQKCRRWGTRIHVDKIDSFRMMQPKEAIKNSEIVGQIFNSCQMAHSWGCQTFSEGYFYLCSRPIFTPSFLSANKNSTSESSHVDGCSIHAPDLAERLRRYLSRCEPLQACRHCLGTSGKIIPWRQLTAAERKSAAVTRMPLSECLDSSRLHKQLRLRGWQEWLYGLFPSRITARILARAGRRMIGE